MGTGGLNLGGRMRAAGVDFKKTEGFKLALAQLKVITSGARKHPRSHLPVDLELVEVIKARGVPTDERRFTVQQDGALYEVVDGCRRTVAGRVAEKWLQKHKRRQPPLEWKRDDPDDPGQLYVESEIVSLSAVDLQIARLSSNKARGLPDSASVLASIVGSIIRLNKGEPDAATMGRIIEAMPQGVTSGVVIALSRWDELSPELQARWESGDAPLGLLPVVLAAAVDEREEVLNKALREGVRTAKGATRRANKAREAKDPWARRMSPRVGTNLAIALHGPDFVPRQVAPLKGEQRDRALLACGIQLGSGREGAVVLSRLPEHLSNAVREARAGKRGAK